MHVQHMKSAFTSTLREMFKGPLTQRSSFKPQKMNILNTIDKRMLK